MNRIPEQRQTGVEGRARNKNGNTSTGLFRETRSMEQLQITFNKTGVLSSAKKI
jgi:hypothetical protein